MTPIDDGLIQLLQRAPNWIEGANETKERERVCAHELISKHSFFTVNGIVHQLAIGSSFGSIFDRHEVGEKKDSAIQDDLTRRDN